MFRRKIAFLSTCSKTPGWQLSAGIGGSFQPECPATFTGISGRVEPEYALAEYYKVYLEKNRDREERVREVDNDYEYTLQQAENHILGLQLIVGSVVFIAFTALLLVVLAIQRDIRMLREQRAVATE